MYAWCAAFYSCVTDWFQKIPEKKIRAKLKQVKSNRSMDTEINNLDLPEDEKLPSVLPHHLFLMAAIATAKGYVDVGTLL